jgi:hypothetical protein
MRAGNALGSHGPLRSLEAYEICGLGFPAMVRKDM